MSPFAGFPDFDSCVKEQMRRHKGEKGFKIENARRICGFLQKRSEAKKMATHLPKHKKKMAEEEDISIKANKSISKPIVVEDDAKFETVG